MDGLRQRVQIAIYGPLLLETVIAYGPIERDEQGKVKLPVTG